MSTFNRVLNEKILEGSKAAALKDNPAFVLAVNNLYERLYNEEERILMDVSEDVREIGAKIKHIAMMRKTISDFVRELDNLIIEGNNASFDVEQQNGV